jgi:SAM-dependent methyltransferase
MWLRTCKRTIFRELKKFVSPYLWTVDAINGVDELAKDEVTFIPEPERFVVISGWCLATRKGEVLADLEVAIGDRRYPALYGLIRTDVSCEYREKRFRHSGFRCLIAKEEVPRGQPCPISLVMVSGTSERVVATGVSFAVDGEKTRGKTFTSSEQLDFSQFRGELMARQYIAGTGIEIGALHAPMSVDRTKAKVLYVDRLPLDQLYRQYPEFKKYDIVAPDIIDGDGELTAVADDCYDFCISNHVLEHLEDPFKALLNWLRVLKPGGILYLSIPLPDNIVDRRRQATPIDHLINDYRLPEKIARPTSGYVPSTFSISCVVPRCTPAGMRPSAVPRPRNCWPWTTASTTMSLPRRCCGSCSTPSPTPCRTDWWSFFATSRRSISSSSKKGRLHRQREGGTFDALWSDEFSD